MPKFRKKPVVIEAVQWQPDEHLAQTNAWPRGWPVKEWQTTIAGDLMIPTLEGLMRASPQDWIIRGVKGEFYPCKPEIFAATYEPA